MADVTHIQTESIGNTHKRTKSSVLKAIVAPLNHKRSPSVGLSLNSVTKTENRRSYAEGSERAVLALPLDCPHRSQPLAESNNNEDRHNSRQINSIEVFESSDKQRKPKKSKSSTSLSALLSRPKSSKSPKKQEQEVQLATDKENHTPPGSSYAPPTPIWAQFASQTVQDVEPTKDIAAAKRWSIEEVVAPYTSNEYSPLKQKNFHCYGQPTLARRPDPSSGYSGSSMKPITDTVSKLQNRSVERLDKLVSQDDHNEQRVHISKEETVDQRVGDTLLSRPFSEKAAEDKGSKPEANKAKCGSRVMAAVVAWNGKTKDSVLEEKEVKEVKVDTPAIESAFENLLVLLPVISVLTTVLILTGLEECSPKHERQDEIS